MICFGRTERHRLPEFTAATNITVNIEMLQPPQVLTKTAVLVTATTTNYDVVGIDEGNVPVFASLLMPFDQWSKGMVYPKTDPASITPKMYSIGTWNGVQLGVPINGKLYVWMTRKDLAENPAYKSQFKAKYGYELGVPKTFKELLEMDTFFHENGIAAGFGPFNGGPAATAAVTGAWAIAIPKASKNQEAAAEFVYWWASKSVADKCVQAYLVPRRGSFTFAGVRRRTRPSGYPSGAARVPYHSRWSRWPSAVPSIPSRFWFRLYAEPGESVYGGGEQFSHFNLCGRRFPLWTSEQGVGRNKRTRVTWEADVADKAGGDCWWTFFPQATSVSTRHYWLHADCPAYAAFDFTWGGFHELEFWAFPESFVIGTGTSMLELAKGVSSLLGKQPEPPEWTHDGVILGMQGGTAVCEACSRR